ncbi:CoA-acylating methylmalonate-semialdehyde dehydrogenase [Microbacterium sediminicola]|uniref:CoA-acylating methylmalonate-semialdehyde dehydrogenase n=1 Tax=Microbacterium sediminicola TaxID=415210 RepID=A0ABP4TY69_9MICO
MTVTPLSLIGSALEPREVAGPSWPVHDPATGVVIGAVPLDDVAAVDLVVDAAVEAAGGWAATPPTKRARLLISLARALEDNADEIVASITRENGKTTVDARAEIARAVEHLEAAATAPALLTGEHVVDILPGLDASVVREPLGVVAVVPPFNFPIMTGLIYWAWALACGNAVIVKPSEQTPFTLAIVGRLALEVGFPPGVFNIVHGGRATVEALCDHPDVAAISLVGSSATAAAVYARASAAGKRVHAAGGARNPIVVMPDVDPVETAKAIAASAFTMGGQRCLSGSVVLTVGTVHTALVTELARIAESLTVGAGSDPDTDVPPLVSRAAVTGAVSAVSAAEAAGARVLVDGRMIVADGGFFFGPTVIDGVGVDSPLLENETFAPLVSIVAVDSLEEALAVVNDSPFGNAACIFTTEGKVAKTFAQRADVGNVGVNVSVAAPTATIAFGGRRRSFRGVIHSQGRHAIEFYTDVKSVSTRW